MMRPRMPVAAAIGAMLALVAVAPAHAAESDVTVADSADTYTASSAPTTEYGTSWSLGVYGSPDITAVMRFVLPATPVGKTLTAASLRVSTTSIPSAGSANSVSVQQAADSWSETGTTYGNRPAVSGPVLGTLPAGTTLNTTYTIALDDSLMATLSGSVTLALKGNGSDSLWLWSRQQSDAALRPLLTLTYGDSGPADGTPPTVPVNVATTVSGSTVSLTWDASSDNVAVSRYNVYRSVDAAFAPDASTKIGSTPTLGFTDGARPVGIWYYRVTAEDAAGNVSAASATASATVQAPTGVTDVGVPNIADTFTASSSPSSDYGTSWSMGVYGSPNVTAVMRFVLPAAPVGKTLTAASLRVATTTISSAGSSDAVTVRQASDSWSESGTTYLNRATVSGPVLGTLQGGTQSNHGYDIPLDASRLAPLTGSTTLALEGTGSDSFWLWSRQQSDPSLRPLLTLTYGDSGPAANSVTIMATGDISCATGTPTTSTTCRQGDVASLIQQSDPYRFIALGDLQYQNATLAEFMGAGAYNGTYGAFKDITLPVLGNHEYLVSPNGYFDYFYGTGVSTGPFGARPDGYYSTSLGSWTFIGLNSECGTGGVTGGCGVGSPEYTWLENVLTTAPTQCTIVAMHRPRWSTGASHGSYPELSALWDLMADHGVDVALAGHNHVSEVFQPIGASGPGATPNMQATGIRAFTAGDGGAEMQAFRPPTDALTSALVARSNSAFGPLQLVLGDGGYSWQFQPIAGMTFTNNGTSGSFSGSDSCH